MKVMEELINICRGCLMGERRMVNATLHASQFKDLTGITISPSDGLPQWLCYECVALLQKCVRFGNKVMRCHYILCQYLLESVPFPRDEEARPYLSLSTIDQWEVPGSITDQLEEEFSPVPDDIDLPVITKLEDVELKDENSCASADNITIEECGIEQQIELRNKSSILTSHHEENRQQIELEEENRTDDIDFPVITKLDEVEMKDENSCASADNITIEECCIEQQIELRNKSSIHTSHHEEQIELEEEISPVPDDIDLPVITKLEDVELKDENSSASADNITIEECCIEQQIELRNKSSIYTSYNEDHRRLSEVEYLSAMEESTSMSSVTEIEHIQIKVEPIYSDHEEDSCESPMINVKKEPDDLEDPIKSPVMVDIEVPAATEIEKVEIKVERVAYNEEDDTEEECREEMPQIDLTSRSSQSDRGTSNHEERTEQDEMLLVPEAMRRELRARVKAVCNSVPVQEHFDKLTGNSDITPTTLKNVVEKIKSNIESEQTADKPHKCDVCMKCFRRKKQLNEHYRIHTGDKPYKCVACMKCFRQKSQLNVHYRVHTGDKPYTCDVCLKCFNQKSQLTVHARIHTGTKPYKCHICMKSFNDNSYYHKHIRLHSGDKPYKCDVCMKGFSQKKNLNDHYTIHTGEKPYKCDICKQCFTVKESLNRHIRVGSCQKK